MIRLVSRGFRFVASYGVSVVLLIFLAILTLVGTLEQVNQGLYAVQERYFASLMVVHWFWGVIPVPLPGVYLLMILVFFNLLFGAILRAAKGWRHWGIFVAHAGILMLLGGSFISFQFSQRGNITLYEGESAAEFSSYESWELAIQPAGPGTVFECAIPELDLQRAMNGRAVTFYAKELPFEITVKEYARNGQPMPATSFRQGSVQAVDGFVLQPMALEREAERNVPAAYVSVRETPEGAARETILWGMSRLAWGVEAGGKQWALSLRRRTWPLPFTIRLDRFLHEVHPGTGIPKAFESEVTKIDGDIQEQAKISMNAPLRFKGYTLYQASWGPPNAQPGEPLYSSLAVVRNPADAWPLAACCVICGGLFLHFALKLLTYLRSEMRRRAV